MEVERIEIEENTEQIRHFAGELARKLEGHFSSLPKPVLKNIVMIVIATVLLLRTPRGWYGRMTLSGIARCMKTPGQVRVRYKRLDRFLTNKRFDTKKTIAGLLELARGKDCQGFLSILIDQSAIGDVQVIAASVPYQGRSIPFYMETFEYGKIRFSQNKIEKAFFTRLQKELGRKYTLIFIMDRGYASVLYIAGFNEQHQLYILRGCSNVIIEYSEGGQSKRISLGRLPHRQGHAKRYRNVIYHDKGKELVDIIVYREKGFKEPWFLIVPAGSEQILPTEEVVAWYRSRMKIEVTFRDFKSHVGVRGLKLKVAKAEKIGRLLVCLAIAYILLIALGDCDFAKQFRKHIEVLRRRPRHGTRRSLSVLTVALFVATDSFLLNVSNLMKLLTSLVCSSVHGLCPVP